MPYTLDFALALGAGKAGLADLRAQLVDTAGANVGAAVSTGFAEVGAGNYLWHYAALPDGHRGGVKFYSNAAPAAVLAFAPVNPQEAENGDAKVSGVAAQVTADHGAGLYTRNAEPDNAGVAAVRAKTDQLTFTAPGRVDATAAGVDPAAVAAAVVGALGAVAVVVRSPLLADGTAAVVRGDDYLAADGRALAWTASGWPDLTGAAVRLDVFPGIGGPAPSVLTVAGTADPTGTGSQTVTVELTAAQTTALAAKPHQYKLTATLAGGHVATLARGTLLVSGE